jgi:hypothetical protein
MLLIITWRLLQVEPEWSAIIFLFLFLLLPFLLFLLLLLLPLAFIRLTVLKNVLDIL